MTIRMEMSEHERACECESVLLLRSRARACECVHVFVPAYLRAYVFLRVIYNACLNESGHF